MTDKKPRLVSDLPRYSVNQVVDMYRALTLAAETFERYEELHRRKGPDGHEKAEQNKYLAIVMRDALRGRDPVDAPTPPSQQEGGR